jgi:hypothetical protein
MTLFNPSNAKIYKLAFTRLAAATGATDGLGNAVQTATTIAVDALVSPLSAARAADLSKAVGIDSGGIPVKVRVEAWPSAIAAQAPAVASLTYNGRSATITLCAMREQNPNAAALTPEIGVSCEGVLVYS